MNHHKTPRFLRKLRFPGAFFLILLSPIAPITPIASLSLLGRIVSFVLLVGLILPGTYPSAHAEPLVSSQALPTASSSALSDIALSVSYPTYPLLINKGNNPLLELTLTLPSPPPVAPSNEHSSPATVSPFSSTSAPPSPTSATSSPHSFPPLKTLEGAFDSDTPPGTVTRLILVQRIPQSKDGKISFTEKEVATLDHSPLSFSLPLDKVALPETSSSAEESPSTLHFVLKCDLSPQTSLDTRLGITCSALTTAEGKLIPHSSQAGSLQVDSSQPASQVATPPVPQPATPSAPHKHRMGYAVRDHKEDKVDTYRIPGIATSPKGTLLAVYDARYESARDLQGHMDIGLSRSTDGGQTWEPMRIVLDQGEWGGLPQKFNGVSDAQVFVNPKNGDIFVAGLWMHGIIDAKTGTRVDDLTESSKNWVHQWVGKASQPGHSEKETCQFLITRSSDDGKTWSPPQNITSIKPKEWWLFAPAPGAGIALRDGTLVLPTQGRDAQGLPFSNITYSKDDGKTWTTSAPASSDTTECAVVELADGTLMLNMRDNRNGKEKGERNGRAVFTTSDLGQTWSEHPTHHKALIEPVCMASLHRHDYTDADGKKQSLLLFSNPDTKNGRNHITLKFSLDDGKTWHKGPLLDQGNSYGYSCLTSLDDDTIGILYESSRAQLVFQRLPLKDILNYHSENH